MKEVVIVSADWKFRVLVRAELRERGYAARGYDSLGEAAAELSPGAHGPAVLVLDAGEVDAGAAGEELVRWATNVPVVLVLGAVGPAIQPPPGVCVLRRPVRVEDVVSSVMQCAEKPG